MPDVTPDFPNFYSPQGQHDAGGRRAIPWPKDSAITAAFSGPGDCYRTMLSEIWNVNKPVAGFILMNPSIAGIRFSDPTASRTGKIARSWGFGGQIIGNVCSYCTTDKARLLEVEDPVGPSNTGALMQIANRVLNSEGVVVIGHGHLPDRLRKIALETVVRFDRWRVPLHFLRMAKDGVTPWHPLYLPVSSRPRQYTRADLEKVEDALAAIEEAA